MNVQVRSVTLTVRPRHALGLLVLAGGLVACAQFVWQAVAALDPRVQAAGLAGLGAALATALGTLPVALQQRSSDRLRDTLLGFGAGVMLAASAFSLVVPALASVRQQGGSGWSAAGIVGCGIVIGAALLLALETWVPHEHFIKGRDHSPERAPLLKRTWLFVFAISAALLPWGLAFAAGAMLFVISHEIIPESHRAGHERHATTGLIVGFVLMMVLDTALV